MTLGLRLCTLTFTVAALSYAETPVAAQSVHTERPTTRPATANAASPKKDVRLILACAAGRSKAALQLIHDGCPVNTRTDQGQSALYFAAASEEEEMISVVRELIARGADVNCRSSDDFTPLHHACCCGRYDAVKLLLDHGADPSAVEKNYGDTPLHVLAYASGQRDGPPSEALRIAILLIGHKADLNAKNKAGKTPLGYARDAERQDQSLIEFLAAISGDQTATRPAGNR